MRRGRVMRDIGIDNLRGVLIFLVVFGHLIEPALVHGGIVKGVYTLIYVFHMPLFAGICGYLSRQTFDLQKVFRGLVVPYIFAEFAYRVFDYFLIGNLPATDAPYWLLWFLVSLACWRLILPIWMRLPFPLGLAVGASLVAGGVDEIDYSFSLSRTIYFFPFFVLGHELSGRRIGDLDYFWLPIVTLLAGVIAMTLIPDAYSVRWTYGSVGYHAQGEGIISGAIIRLGHYVAALVLGFSVISLIPGRESFLTVIGANTMMIFVGHGFVVLALRELGYGDTGYILASSAFLAAMICGVAVIWVAVRKRTSSLS